MQSNTFSCVFFCIYGKEKSVEKFIKTIIVLCVLTLSVGCSKSRLTTTNEFVQDLLEYTVTSPKLNGQSYENTDEYDAWVEQAKEEFNTSMNDACLEDLFKNALSKLEFSLSNIPSSLLKTAVISNNTIKEISDDVYGGTVELSDEQKHIIKINIRIQYKDDQISFIEVVPSMS